MAKPKPTAMYRVGLNPDAPYDVVHLAGFEFPKRSERVEGYGASTKRSVVQGTILVLTDEDVAAIKKAAAEKVFRFGREVEKRRGAKTTKHRRAFIVSKAGAGFVNGKATKPYVEQEDDVPVGRFVFMEKTEYSPLKDEHFEPLLGDEPAADQKPSKQKAS